MRPSIIEDSVISGWERSFSDKGITSLRLFAHGKRGIILKGERDGKEIAIKIAHPQSGAVGRIAIEAMNLQRVNALDIGPRYLFHGSREGQDYVAYGFVSGILLGELLENGPELAFWKRIASVVLEQMYRLDLAGLTKEEMHHPPKHVVISPDGNPTLLDFERMHVDISPQNIRQWCQYLSSKYVAQKTGVLWDDRHGSLRPLLVAYKTAMELYLGRQGPEPLKEFLALKAALGL